MTDNELYESIYSLYTQSEVYERKIALNLSDFMPTWMNVSDKHNLCRNYGIYKVYFRDIDKIDLYADVRVLLLNNSKKLMRLKYDFTIHINKYYPCNKLLNEKLFILEAPVYFNIKMKNIVVYAGYVNHVFENTIEIKSWINSGLNINLESARLSFSLKMESITEIYKLFISLLKSQVCIQSFYIYIYDVHEFIELLDDMLFKFNDYVSKHINQFKIHGIEHLFILNLPYDYINSFKKYSIKNNSAFLLGWY